MLIKITVRKYWSLELEVNATIRFPVKSLTICAQRFKDFNKVLRYVEFVLQSLITAIPDLISKPNS